MFPGPQHLEHVAGGDAKRRESKLWQRIGFGKGHRNASRSPWSLILLAGNPDEIVYVPGFLNTAAHTHLIPGHPIPPSPRRPPDLSCLCLCALFFPEARRLQGNLAGNLAGILREFFGHARMGYCKSGSGGQRKVEKIGAAFWNSKLL